MSVDEGERDAMLDVLGGTCKCGEAVRKLGNVMQRATSCGGN